MMRTFAMAVIAAGLLAAGGTLVGSAFSRLPAGAAQTRNGSQVPNSVIHDTVTITDTVEDFRSEIPVVAVHFPSGSVELQQSEREKLDLILRAARAHDKMSLILDGYSDTTGGAVIDNDNLASRRTFALYRFLLENGISKERMYMRSFGALKSSGGGDEDVRKVDVSLSEVFR